MGKKSSDKPILGGSFILVYPLINKLPGDLPNEIIFRHPVTKARAMYVLRQTRLCWATQLVNGMRYPIHQSGASRDILNLALARATIGTISHCRSGDRPNSISRMRTVGIEAE